MRENRLIPLALTPAHLPREIHRLEPEEAVARSVAVSWIIWEVSAEQLELVSSSLKVISTERVKKPVKM